MKQLLVILLLTAVATVFAADKSSGCGLGWRVTKSMTTTGSSTRSCTNGTFSNIFAMTSGTSGCSRHSLVLNHKMEVHFMEANMDRIAVDVANGHGEYLNGLARVLGCKDSIRAIFSREVQGNFEEVFPAINSRAYDSLIKIKSLIQSNPLLAVGCNTAV